MGGIRSYGKADRRCRCSSASGGHVFLQIYLPVVCVKQKVISMPIGLPVSASAVLLSSEKSDSSETRIASD